MARYLVVLTRNPQLAVQLFHQVFKLKYACTPDEVTVPGNTVLFFFANADVESAEEFQSAFLGFKIGRVDHMDCNIPYSVEDDKLYVIGKRTCIDGQETIYNPNTNTLIPSMFLKYNYEVIDM